MTGGAYRTIGKEVRLTTGVALNTASDLGHCDYQCGSLCMIPITRMSHSDLLS